MKLCSDVFWLRPGQLTSAQASVVVTGGEDGGSVRVARALLVADSGLLRAVLDEGEVESRVHVARSVLCCGFPLPGWRFRHPTEGPTCRSANAA